MTELQGLNWRRQWVGKEGGPWLTLLVGAAPYSTMNVLPHLYYLWSLPPSVVHNNHFSCTPYKPIKNKGSKKAPFSDQLLVRLETILTFL